MWEPTLPYVLRVEAVWVGVWALAGAGAAGSVFERGTIVAAVVAIYWFLCLTSREVALHPHENIRSIACLSGRDAFLKDRI